MYTAGIVLALVIGLLVEGGCQSSPARNLLSAPTNVIAPAVQHNEAGILAYEQGQWEQARQDFEAAIMVAPSLAEAHFNLGMTLYKLRAFKDGDRHFIEAANLAPGNKVIWNSLALKHVTVPEKVVPGGTDGQGHAH